MSLRATVSIGTEPSKPMVDILMPLRGWSKARVVEYLTEQGVQHSQLWTCYEDTLEPCGVCYHCEEYQKALCDPSVQRAMHKAIR